MKYYNSKIDSSILIKLLILASVITFIIYAYTFYRNNPRDEKSVSNLNIVYKNKIQNIKLEIANDNEERVLGLSNRINLSENAGMLFFFEDEAVRSFWMKDMNFNIDIIYLNKEKQIISIYKNVSKDSYDKSNPRRSLFINSIIPSKYVIELNANKSTDLNLQIGDVLDF
jgi:uncharacterized membrane protein (UPF0127 family)